MKNPFRRGKPTEQQGWLSRLIHLDAASSSSALFTYHLRGKLEQEGCPLCRLVRESEEHWVWTLLYEFTGDPEIHAKFAAAGGVCSEHATLIQQVTESRQLVTPSGVARLYETVTREFLGEIAHPRPEQDCPLCRYRHQAEERYAYFLATTLADPKWREALSHSDGLCVPHFKLTLAQANREVRDYLIEEQARRLKDLLHRLRELQRKQRYDVPEPVTPAESIAWREALWRFGGMRFDRLLVRD